MIDNSSGDDQNKQDFINKLVPTDLIAFVVILGGLVLIGLGINGLVGGLLISVVAYYFGKRGRPPTDNPE